MTSAARTMKRCEEKIHYRTAAGAKWALWGIWLDRHLRGGGIAATGRTECTSGPRICAIRAVRVRS